MLRDMTAEQFNEWLAYYQIEPWGTLVDDLEMAHWKALYANANRKQGKPSFKAEKFLIFKDKKADASAIYSTNEEF